MRDPDQIDPNAVESRMAPTNASVPEDTAKAMAGAYDNIMDPVAAGLAQGTDTSGGISITPDDMTIRNTMTDQTPSPVARIAVEAAKSGSLPARANAVATLQNEQSIKKESAYKSIEHEAINAHQQILDEVDAGKTLGHLGVVEDFAKKAAQNARDFQDKIQLQQIKYGQAVKDFQENNPNPWADRGVGFTIGRAIAVGLNQAGIALSGGQGYNLALKITDDALARDLQQHRLMLDQKEKGINYEGNILQRMREIYKDNETAAQAAKSAMYDLVAARAQHQLMAKQPQLRTLDDQKFVAGIAAKAEEEHRKVVDKTVDNIGKNFNAEQANAAKQATLSLKKEQLLQMPPGLFGELGSQFDKSPKSVKASDAYIATTGVILPAFKSMNQILNMPVGQKLERETYQSFRQAAQQALAAAKRLHGDGANFTESEQFLEKSILGTDQTYLETVLADDKGRRLLQKGLEALVTETNASLTTFTGKSLTYWMQVDANHKRQENRLQAQKMGMNMGDDTEQAAPNE